jgi:hypothetical protein
MKPDSVSDRNTVGEEGMMRESKPAACYQSSRTDLKCRACGDRPAVIHIPTRHVGYFCGECCPPCRLKAAVVALAEWREIHPDKSAAKE